MLTWAERTLFRGRLLVSFSQFSPGLALIQLASLFYSWPITEPSLGASCKPDACLFMQRQSVFSLFRVLVARMVRARSWDGAIKSEFVVCEAAAVAVCSVCYILQYRVRKRCGSWQHQTWFAFQCDRVSSSCVRGVEWSICRRRAPVRLDFTYLSAT